MIADLPSCDWSQPGRDAYTGTARAAIERMATIPEPVRAVLIARADKHDFDDTVVIDRDSIRSPKHDYAPQIEHMAFGSRGRVCATVTRDGWTPEHTETAWVYCEQGYCIAMPAVCRNWSVITRLEPVAGPQVLGVATPETAVLPVGTPVGPVFTDSIATTPAPNGGLWTAQPDAPGWGQPGPGYAVYWPPVISWGPCVACAAPCLPAPVPAVPEPSTLILMLAGIASLVGWRAVS